jgi:hypothetical protein
MISICMEVLQEISQNLQINNNLPMFASHVRWVPVTTARSVPRLQMKEQPPAMEGSCEHTE